MTAQFSVVICAYTEDRWNQLVTAVDSVHKQTLPPAEVIVVIDHNNKLFKRCQEEIRCTRIIKNTQSQGLSGARNSGINAAKYDLIAFMDEDASADPNWLEILAESYRDPMVMGVGGSILPWWISGKPAWFPGEFNWVVGCTYRGFSEGIAPVRNLLGCNMSFRKDVLLATGGFRSGIGRYGTTPYGCEETELCIRASDKYPTGLFISNPAAKVIHRVPPARAQFSYFKSRCYAEGLSKALVTHYVGNQNGLRSERTYTFKTLPAGVLQGIADTIHDRTPDGLLRSGAIIIGLIITTWGFIVGKASAINTISSQIKGKKAEYQLND
jgi:glycosyltransferase involved in cell wall biosynthesis